MKQRRLLTLAEAAAYLEHEFGLAISVAGLDTACRRLRLPSRKIGAKIYIAPDDVRHLIEGPAWPFNAILNRFSAGEKHRRQRRFLTEYIVSGNTEFATKATGVAQTTHRDWLYGDPNYRAAFDSVQQQLLEVA